MSACSCAKSGRSARRISPLARHRTGSPRWQMVQKILGDERLRRRRTRENVSESWPESGRRPSLLIIFSSHVTCHSPARRSLIEGRSLSSARFKDSVLLPRSRVFDPEYPALLAPCPACERQRSALLPLCPVTDREQSALLLRRPRSGREHAAPLSRCHASDSGRAVLVSGCPESSPQRAGQHLGDREKEPERPASLTRSRERSSDCPPPVSRHSGRSSERSREVL